MGSGRKDASGSDDDQRHTLLVETKTGLRVVRILSAAPLAPGAPPGPAAEEATRSAAATFGLPDFVFRPQVDNAASSNWEIGDAVLVVGRLGAVVQIKARVSSGIDERRERAWLDKRLVKASNQATGTVRTLTSAPVSLTNYRGHEILVDGPATDWVRVVVVDHPSPPRGYIPDPALRTDVVLTRSDWEFLFGQLVSTAAVLGYLHRIKADGPIELGTEAFRYFEMAIADEAAPPDPADPGMLATGGAVRSAPLLPLIPQGGLRRMHVPFRVLLEDIATSPWDHERGRGDYLDVLAALDTTPVDYRLELGGDLLDWLADHHRSPDGPEQARLRLRRLTRSAGAPLLIFAVSDHFDQILLDAFGGLVRLRHQQHAESTHSEGEALTVGVLLSIRRDGLRLWDTSVSAVRGAQDMAGEERAALEALWPLPEQVPSAARE